MKVVKSCLEDFDRASVQKVSLVEARTTYSKNVSNSLSKASVSECGFKMTKKLEKYAGVPLIHGIVTLALYQSVIVPTLTGLIALAQTSVAAIPQYIV